MSRAQKGKPKLDNEVSEKDQRMKELEEEIKRLEEENKALKRDSVEYENRLQAAVVRGAAAVFNTERVTTVNLSLESKEKFDEYVSSDDDDDDDDEEHIDDKKRKKENSKIKRRDKTNRAMQSYDSKSNV